MTRVERLRKLQKEVWESALEKFNAMRSCNLGICVELDARQTIADTDSNAKNREKAKEELQIIRAERQKAWDNVMKLVDQLSVAIFVEQRYGDGSNN